jgi:metal-sulfur cluster biosynthetic enzyme
MPIPETAIREALRLVIDPELGINIVDLGLVYAIEIDGARVRVVMTMTTPACPLSDYVKDLIDSALRQSVPEVEDVEIDLVWEPPWDADMMSDEARQQLDGGTRRS